MYLFTVSAGTTCRTIWENDSAKLCFPHVKLFNAGATEVYLRTSTMSSGSSESSGYALKSSQYSHEFQMSPGDKLYVFTTAATCLVNVHVWGESSAEPPAQTS